MTSISIIDAIQKYNLTCPSEWVVEVRQTKTTDDIEGSNCDVTDTSADERETSDSHSESIATIEQFGPHSSADGIVQTPHAAGQADKNSEQIGPSSSAAAIVLTPCAVGQVDEASTDQMCERSNITKHCKEPSVTVTSTAPPNNSRCLLFSSVMPNTQCEMKSVETAPEKLDFNIAFPALLDDEQMQARVERKRREDDARRMAREEAKRRAKEEAERKRLEDDARHRAREEAKRRAHQEAEERRRRARQDAQDQMRKANNGAVRAQFKPVSKSDVKRSLPTLSRSVARASIGELVLPQAGGRVHFSGCLMWDEQVCGHCSIPYTEDEHSEYVGEGRYPSNMKAFPKAIRSTFDAVAVDAGTRVTIYSEPNFKGKILWDRTGPALVCNSIWKNQGHAAFKGRTFGEVFVQEWEGPLQTVFPPEVREFSCSDMHRWNTGSLVIQGGQSIPSELDAIDEYKLLSNQRH